MRNVIINIHDGTKTIATHHVQTNSTQPTVIKAQRNVNYEFVDADRGVAPNHIVTKRVGKDLYITLNESESNSGVLIIDGFYKYPESGLIGLSEGGHYYYFIPDTSSVADYVTQMDSDMIDGHALGGEPFELPWWVGESSSLDLSSITDNVSPWMLGVAVGAGTLALVLSGNDDDDDTNKPNSKPNTKLDKIEVDSDNLTADCTDGKDVVNINLASLLDDTGESSVIKIATINDFNENDDVIQLSKTLFSEVDGDLSNLSEYLEYDKTTGKLSYDSDGNGTTAEAVHFATLTNNTDLVIDGSNFQII